MSEFENPQENNTSGGQFGALQTIWMFRKVRHLVYASLGSEYTSPDSIFKHIFATSFCCGVE